MTDILPWDHPILLLWNERMTLSLIQRDLWCTDEKYYIIIRHFYEVSTDQALHNYILFYLWLKNTLSSTNVYREEKRLIFDRLLIKNS